MNTPSNISPLRHHHDLPAPKPFRKTLRRSTRLLNLEQAANRRDFDSGDMIDDDDVSIGIGKLSSLGLTNGRNRRGRYSMIESNSSTDDNSASTNTDDINTSGSSINSGELIPSNSFSLKRPHPSADNNSPNANFPTKPKFPSRTFEHELSITQSTSTPVMPTSSTPVPPFIPPIWSNPIKRRDSFDQLFSPTSPFAGLGQSTPIANDNNNNNNSNSFNASLSYQFSSTNPYTTSPSPSPIPASKSHHLHIHASDNHNNSHTNHPPLPRQPASQIHRLKPKFNPSITAEFSDYHTPENYRSVKPLQTAFMSTGLLSKRNRMNSLSSSDGFRIPPDTPCKKPSNTSLPLIHHNTMFGTPTTPSSHTSSNNGRRRSNLGLHDSLLRFSVDFGNTSTQAAEDSIMNDEIYQEPETPTKDSNHFLIKTSIFPPMNSNKSIEEQTHLSTTPQSGSRWTDSSDHSSSPRTPDIVMNSEQINDLNDASITSHPMIRRTTNTSTFSIEPPKTPAKTPKTPIDPLMNGASSFLRKSSVDIDDPVLISRFDNVSLVGRGEFSIVYSLSIKEGDESINTNIPNVTPINHPNDNRFAVKRTRFPFLGPKARFRRLEEVEILRSLTTPLNNGQHSDEVLASEEGRDYVLMLLDAWEANGYLYIMTEFCENGSLDTFLSERGNVSKLDEWRVWKILVEIALGLRYIHERGFLHLDIKPANILITFEGMLKIGDFGMATPYPAIKGIEREGDREYIAPEVLSSQQYDKPADVFSLGIMMLEIAANIVLPDNGIHWQKLRSGDLTDAGRLSSGDLHFAGEEEEDDDDECDNENDDLSLDNDSRTSLEDNDGLPPIQLSSQTSCNSNNSKRKRKNGSSIPSFAPKFMVDNSGALDQIVKWMLYPEPNSRPTTNQILMTEECQWVEAHRKAGAVIYEGDYGPDPGDDNEGGLNEMLQDDKMDGEEMFRKCI